MSTPAGQAQTSPHAPLASLAAHWHACRGDIPPPLVGASVTMVDDPDPTKAKLYLFGGRLVTTRKMMNDLYELDLTTLRWTKLFSNDDTTENHQHQRSSSSRVGSTSSSNPDQNRPQPRYFHSCNLWERKLIIFGGMGYVNGNESELCVLNEVVAFDLTTNTWDLDFISSTLDNETLEDTQIPQARYAHLSSTTVDSLIIIGGQDMANRYVEEINVLDLKQKKWIVRQAYEKQRGSYRSLAVEPLWKVEESSIFSPTNTSNALDTAFDQNTNSATPRGNPFLSTQAISTLPTSYREWTSDGKLKPLPVYVYTNYNFTDVKREMEVVSVGVEDAEGKDDQCTIQIEDQSQAMSGISLPPGLRFPMGAVLGSHMLISGTYLANTSQTFAIWALHLPTMTWNRLDVGPLLSTGSWNRGILWPLQNRLVVFGHRDRDLVADYNHRQTNWDHVLLIELEAWGITQPPVKQMSLSAIQLGLQKLTSSTVGSYSASMESGIGPLDEETGDPILSLGGRGDFEIVCSDGMRLGCDRIVLENRWPWFAARMREYQRRAKAVAKTDSSLSMPKKGSRPSTGEQLSALLEEDEDGSSHTTLRLATSADPRITPRQLHISEPSPVMLALLIFLYTKCVCTQLQQHPAIVAALLIVSKVYDLKDLEVWAKHTAHVVMSRDLAPRSTSTPSFTGAMVVGGAMSRRSSVKSNPLNGSLPPLERHRLAVALYEAATMSGFEALQIRSLRTVMSIAKWVQRSSISSNRSSATHESSTEAGGQVLQTPTTATIGTTSANTFFDQQSQQQNQQRSPEGGEQYHSLRSGPTSIASPPISRRDSLAKPSNQENNEGNAASMGNSRRPSRVERNLAVTGTDDGSTGDSTPQLSNTNSTPSVPLSRTSTQGSQTTPGASSHASPPPLVNQRRPSAVSSTNSVNNSTRPPPPSSSASSSGTKKRFSIFGRTSDQSGSKSASSISPSTPLENHQEEKSRTSNDSSSSFPRLQRSSTSGSTGNTETMSVRSSSSRPDQPAKPLFFNTPIYSASRKPTNSLTFNNRSRTATEGSNGGKSSVGPDVDPVAEAKVITPTLSSTKQMPLHKNSFTSTSSALPSLASPTSETSSSFVSLPVSEKKPSNGKDHRLDKGKLNPKDIKALHGIFA